MNFLQVYHILSQFSDAEIQLEENGQKFDNSSKVTKPKSKEELKQCVANFLITDKNLEQAFIELGKIYKQPELWHLSDDFLKPYRFIGNYVKLLPLVDDLFS